MAWVTDAEFKAWVRLDVDDTLDDANVALAVAAAHRTVEHHCGRTFDTVVGPSASATARLYTPQFRDLVLVDDFWTDTGLVVEARTTGTGAWTTVDPARFQLEPLNGVVAGRPGFPYYWLRLLDRTVFTVGYGATVRVTAKWGWATAPDDVRFATMIQASRLLKRREAPQGLLEFAGDGGSVRVSPLDGDVLRLLQPFVRPERQLGIGV